MAHPGSAPRVSVVIPTRNRAEVLPRALHSVLAQTMADLEVVVVDDGSADGTAALERTVTDPRVVWLTGPHAGVSAARNRGIDAARGEWVAFLDDDNEWLPGYLAHQLAVADAAGADVVWCPGVDVDPDGTRHPQSPPPADDPLLAATHGRFPFTSSVVVRRDALVATGGFPVELSHGEDAHVLTALALRHRWAGSREALLVRHRHGGPRLTDDRPAYERACAELDRRFGRAVQGRVGLRAAMRWYWRYVGRFEFARVLAADEGRAAAWASLLGHRRALPRSAATMARTAVVVVLGGIGYERVWAAYARARRALADRLRT